MKRLNIATGGKWEPIIGYSRVVRVGDVVYVSGTTATDAKGNIVGVGNPYRQTKQALANIASALARAGARLEDVVRTRLYVTHIAEWEQIGRAHGEFFGRILPATAMIEVSRLVGPDMLVEIEAEAILGAKVSGKTSLLGQQGARRAIPPSKKNHGAGKKPARSKSRSGRR